VRTFDKTLVLVPNKSVANENIQNYSAMPIRRIKLYLGVSYESSGEQIESVVQAIRRLLSEHPAIDQNFWMVNFTDMGAYSLDILIYCFTQTTVWAEYMEVRQALLLKIIEICDERGVEIAFPTQTLYHRRADESDSGLPAEFRRGADQDLPAGLRRADEPSDAGARQAAEYDSADSDENG
jgi:MscS family membrane protein